jgi:hypothetical protein
MGSITRSFANNIGSSGILTASAVTNATIEDVTSFDNAASNATLVLLSTQTASASATISFTTGLDSTYDEYIFKFINIHPSSDSNTFQFQGSTDGGSNYGVNITSTFFRAYHDEADTGTGLEYITNSDLAQSTSFQPINQLNDLGSDNDQNLGGTLTLFNPSSTTYVKHFINTINYSHPSDYSLNTFLAGYFNTTSAINAIQFKMASGNIDDGIIKLYGVKKS